MVAVAASLLAVAAHSQVSESIEVRLIEVDAVVTDRAGHPVAGLTADDFELFENGKRQAITNFSEYRQTVAATRSAAPDATQPSVSQPGPRTILFFIDALPIRGPARTKFFDQLRSLFTRVMREGDRAQVVVWNDNGGLRTVSALTTDRKAVENAIAAAEGNLDILSDGATVQEYSRFFEEMAEAQRFEPTEANASIDTTQRNVAEYELAVMRRKTAAMQRIISALAQPNGRSVFVYVSERFPMQAGKRASSGRRSSGDLSAPPEGAMRSQYSTQRFLEGVINAANASGVSFYALRPDRPRTAGIDIDSGDSDAAVVNNASSGTEDISDELVLQNEVTALSLVAEQTGGAFGVGPQRVEEIVDRIVRDVGSYYTLAYRARSDGGDRQRKIEVRAKNREYVVRARKSVVEKSDRTRARELVIARLFETGPAGDLEFEVTTGKPAAAGRNRVTIPVDLSIPAAQLRFESEGSENAAKFSVLAVGGGDPSKLGEIYEESRRLVAPADKPIEGSIKYSFSILHDQKPSTLAIAVFDEKSGLAGTRVLRLGATDVTVERPVARAEAPPRDPIADAAWIAQAGETGKPIVAFFKSRRCPACDAFERQSLTHPAIERRLQQVVFATTAADQTVLAVFDQTGRLRARWNGVPRDTTTFGTILDSVLAAAPHFDLARRLTQRGPYEGEVEAAIAYWKLGQRPEARAAIDRAIANGSEKTRGLGTVAAAMLDVGEGQRVQALQSLRKLASNATDADVKASAFIGIGMIHRANDETAEAIRAFTAARDAAGPQSDLAATAEAALTALRSEAGPSPIRILPFHEQIVSGRRSVRTIIASAAIARVAFSVDGGETVNVTKPPFSTVVDFGRVPQPHTIRAVAHDQKGKELGRAELVVNDAGETFWLRLIEPAQGAASATVHVSTAMRAPSAHHVQRVVVSWNGAERAVMTGTPWTADVSVPNEAGILRAVAELDDGRTAEDAVLLNGSGYADRSDVALVELPVTISGGAAGANDLIVREGRKQLAVESITAGTDAPLTIGLLIDTSSSMQKNLPDAQEAAIRFLDTTLGENGRAFLITFDTRAQLIQTATSDRDALRRQILKIRPAGGTALHDAMILGLLQFEGVKGRRALVVFSDGADHESRYRLDDVTDVARRSNIPIYFIAARPPMPLGSGRSIAPPPAPRGGAGRALEATPVETDPAVLWANSIANLARVSNSTGGRAHTIRDLTELAGVYEKIAEDLRAQALVTIRTEAGKNENDWRSIEVAMRGRDVRAPAGYYAPW